MFAVFGNENFFIGFKCVPDGLLGLLVKLIQSRQSKNPPLRRSDCE
jgi:hypothetical protein